MNLLLKVALGLSIGALLTLSSPIAVAQVVGGGGGGDRPSSESTIFISDIKLVVPPAQRPAPTATPACPEGKLVVVRQGEGSYSPVRVFLCHEGRLKQWPVRGSR